eukprot:CCRYP_010340-RA/>CCRYP_010340-RA protein AED:0.00 eAED:0.00 QI:175/-1/1/1/-1/1/1/688/455
MPCCWSPRVDGIRRSTMNSATKWMALLALSLPLVACLALSPRPSSSITPNTSCHLDHRRTSKGISSHYCSLRASSSSLDPQGEPSKKKQPLPKPLRRQRSLLEPSTPTPQTLLEPLPTSNTPKRHKVVVFGATGRIGRRVLQTLLRSNVDVDVVAFVRNYEKLHRVLYNDDEEGDYVLEGILQRNNDNKGPKLRVVIGDLVWNDTMYSTPTSPHDDNSTSTNTMQEYHQQALTEAIAGSTALISCVGSYRPTNFWMDYLRVPFVRVWRRDVSRWCEDRNHPYYVHYWTTRRILEEAEREQRRREAYMELERERVRLEERQLEKKKKRTMRHEERGLESSIAEEFRRKRQTLGKVDSYSNSVLFADLMAENNSTMPLKSAAMTDRIKFIRISDVNVGRNPWRLGNVLVNVFRSLVLRYEDMGEKLMKTSDLVDTIVVRVGDITGEERVRCDKHFLE